MKYVLRKVNPEEVDAALALALEVFMQFEAPDYSEAGTANFKRSIIGNKEFAHKCRSGDCPLYGAFDGDKIIGLMGMRDNRTHINLVFVKKEYHRKGIATALFKLLLDQQLRENPALETITVNSSPYGRPFYHALGFTDTDVELESDGILYTPMIYRIDS